MKTILWGALLAVVSASGCVSMDLAWGDKNPATSDTKLVQNPPPAPPPIVKPEQVNGDNAYKIVEALETELDADNGKQ